VWIVLQKDNRDLKKSAFTELRNQNYTFDEIRRVLGVSERTLYLWQNEIDDEQYHEETKQNTEISEHEQHLQKQIDELTEQLEQLSHYYGRLWRQFHLKQNNSDSEMQRAYRIFFEIKMNNDRKNQAILSQQLQRSHEFEAARKAKEDRPSKPDLPVDLHFEERLQMLAKWNKEIDIRKNRISIDASISEGVPSKNVMLIK